MNSQLFKLNVRDFAKGLLIAVLTAVFASAAQLLQVSGLNLDWWQLLSIAVSAGMAYVSKNFLSDESGRVLGGF